VGFFPPRYMASPPLSGFHFFSYLATLIFFFYHKKEKKKKQTHKDNRNKKIRASQKVKKKISPF
jgi:hypothetical protein